MNDFYILLAQFFSTCLLQYLLNSTCKCNRILINNLFKFFVWREVSKLSLIHI